MNKKAPTIIITGASQGLGAAMAVIAATCGAQVVLAARSPAGLATQEQRIQEHGGSAFTVVADVTKEEDCRRIVDQALQRYGEIDALVNNAAIIEPLDVVANVSLGDWTHHFAVNVFGPLMMSQLAVPHLRRTRWENHQCHEPRRRSRHPWRQRVQRLQGRTEPFVEDTGSGRARPRRTPLRAGRGRYADAGRDPRQRQGQDARRSLPVLSRPACAGPPAASRDTSLGRSRPGAESAAGLEWRVAAVGR